MGKTKIIVYTYILLVSCEDRKSTQNDPYFLDLYMDTKIENNEYIIDYNTNRSNSYTTIYYQTIGNTFVNWSSPDSFCVPLFNDLICDPIVNYSTYSREDGSGQQMVRLEKSFVGRSVSVKGCLSNGFCTSLSFSIR